MATADRVLGDTGSGQARHALHRVRAADPLPDLPALDVDHLPFGCHGCSQGSASVSVRTPRTTG